MHLKARFHVKSCQYDWLLSNQEMKKIKEEETNRCFSPTCVPKSVFEPNKVNPFFFLIFMNTKTSRTLLLESIALKNILKNVVQDGVMATQKGVTSTHKLLFFINN